MNNNNNNSYNWKADSKYEYEDVIKNLEKFYNTSKQVSNCNNNNTFVISTKSNSTFESLSNYINKLPKENHKTNCNNNNTIKIVWSDDKSSKEKIVTPNSVTNINNNNGYPTGNNNNNGYGYTPFYTPYGYYNNYGWPSGNNNNNNN